MTDAQTRHRIRQIRKARGMTQAQLSWRTGIHQSTLCQLEKGYIKLYDGHLAKIARALKMSVAELRGQQPQAKEAC